MVLLPQKKTQFPTVICGHSLHSEYHVSSHENPFWREASRVSPLQRGFSCSHSSVSTREHTYRYITCGNTQVNVCLQNIINRQNVMKRKKGPGWWGWCRGGELGARRSGSALTDLRWWFQCQGVGVGTDRSGVVILALGHWGWRRQVLSGSSLAGLGWPGQGRDGLDGAYRWCVEL